MGTKEKTFHTQNSETNENKGEQILVYLEG